MPEPKKTVLFVGAGGAVASKLIPELARHYDIVGIVGHRQGLAPYCIELLAGELTSGHARLFNEAFSRYKFDAIIWNAVRYHPMPLAESSRGTLHLEFDLAIALPLECLKTALACGFAGSFIFVTSGLAFGVKPSWGSYSIAKRGQVITAEYLSTELGAQGVRAKAIALGTITDLPAITLQDAFMHAIENTHPEKTLYRVYDASWE